MTTYQHLFSPLTVGRTTVKNRVVLPPHAHVVSSLWGSDDDVAGHLAYWAARTEAGWVDGVSAHVRNSLIPGFEPTGIGAITDGHFRQPWFVDRVGRLADLLHAEETVLTVQMILQGGMPHAASSVLSGPVVNLVPHALTSEEIDYFVAEYGYSAGQTRLAGADGVELHMNHDDMLEWFLSPLTNRRDDEYGGDLAGRMRFPERVLNAVREALGPSPLLGVRLNIREDEPGGYDVDGAIAIAQRLENLGIVDYVSLTAGTPWGSPSYIQSHHHRPAAWAPLAGRIREALLLPVVYTGRVTSPALAESILVDRHADLIGMARAHIADADLLAKARTGREDEIRPCVGGNECISRRIVENTAFSCAVNPVAAREARGPAPDASVSRRILVVGGGPAGLELSGISAERGHDVTLWEAENRLGGQLRIATQCPGYDDYRAYLDWQEGRLRRAGVAVELGRRATVDDVLDHAPDIVAVATGGRPRSPGIIGEELPHVHQAAEVLAGTVELGPHVLVVAQDDHLPPLAVADHLGEAGHRVTMVYGTSGPAPSVSRYLLGSALARVDEHDVRIRTNEQVDRITEDHIRVRHVYSQKTRTMDDVDSVVLSCGATPVTDLAEALHPTGLPTHVLGDAYAPRRLVWATRQAYDLAISL